jgi:alpha-tubulin suppressor-like RCC1 family protein
MINIDDCKEIVKIASGKNHTCLLTDLGKVFTYGDKPKTGNDKPTLVPELQHLVFTNISCGAHTVFAVDKQGTVYTWGRQSAPEVVEHLKK